MPIKCSVYIAVSLDGFIARANGDVDWLENPNYTMPDVFDFGYHAFIDSVDALVMGRNSFEKVLTFGAWPYDGTPVVVLTHRPLDIPHALADKVRTLSGTPQAIVDQLAATGKKHLYIDGGITIQRFLQARLIDEITLTQIPILLGDGIRLFDTLEHEHHLKLENAQGHPNGFVQTKYQMIARG